LAESGLTQLERESSESETKHKMAVTALSEAKRLERCVNAWGLAELEKLKQQVEDDKSEVIGAESSADRDQLEKELDKLEGQITAKRNEIQGFRGELENRKAQSERWLAELYG
jgi:predicted  nucleic acid-binding Zn-ribbon protein